MNDGPLPNSEIILYQTEDGGTRVQCRFENETVCFPPPIMPGWHEVKGIRSRARLKFLATAKQVLKVW